MEPVPRWKGSHDVAVPQVSQAQAALPGDSLSPKGTEFLVT